MSNARLPHIDTLSIKSQFSVHSYVYLYFWRLFSNPCENNSTIYSGVSPDFRVVPVLYTHAYQRAPNCQNMCIFYLLVPAGLQIGRTWWTDQQKWSRTELEVLAMITGCPLTDETVCVNLTDSSWFLITATSFGQLSASRSSIIQWEMVALPDCHGLGNWKGSSESPPSCWRQSEADRYPAEPCGPLPTFTWYHSDLLNWS